MCRLACSGRFAQTEPRSVWSFASDLFYSAQCFQPFLSIYSLLLSNPPVYEARGVL